MLGPNEFIRGTAFGPDGLLYAVVPSHTGIARVVSMDENGTILDSYYFTSFSGSNTSYGKMAFGNEGKFYVTSGVGLVEFTIGNTASGDLINSTGFFDVECLPNGNLLVAWAYGLRELDPTGNVLRTINISDPYGNAPGTSIGFTDLRGVAYDPVENSIFVTQLGHSGFNFRLIKLESDTGFLLDHEYFWYADEISLNAHGVLAVASRTQDPGFFNKNLNFLGPFQGGDGRYFVTTLEEVVVGDINCDGVIDLLDVDPFVELLTSGQFDEKADINGDGVVDLLDVNPFVALLTMS